MGFFDFLSVFTSSQSRNFVSLETSRRISREWENVSVMLKGGTPSQLRQAIITADKMMDTALKDLVAGEKMAERLKNARDKFDKGLYNKIWEAHKLRNNLVHEVGFEPPHFVVREAVENIRYALSLVGVKI